MNRFLRIVQGLLAAVFAASGVLKTTKSREQLSSQLPWASDVPTPVVRLIGTAELVGALGLFLPGVSGIATVLTPLAATGIAVIVGLAMGFHARRKEPQGIAFNAVLLTLAAVVMWGRFGPHAF
ncbi:DoxX family protein [Streptomyces sp. DSM 40750]|uniref:DoxX family protein n=1 Tax=Streptomyces sp. DSM 40750 TaxID=2801030 RepID=UPI00214AE533|nr:DoxX family protein [Streptomyces sp. DSM 40750]UUU19194.1 DoxX family protein [Streptomyces sp. DSM 40750]UUU27462.1 DoxX family protein [Streptomyces sp. DSM 40750]